MVNAKGCETIRSSHLRKCPTVFLKKKFKLIKT